LLLVVADPFIVMDVLLDIVMFIVFVIDATEYAQWIVSGTKGVTLLDSFTVDTPTG
jgi:hypothetical protein